MTIYAISVKVLTGFRSYKEVGLRIYPIFYLLVFLPFPLNAGYMIKEEVKQSGFTGEIEDIRTTYISETGIKTEDSRKIIIMKIVNGEAKIYQVDKLNKTYQDLSMMAPMMVLGFTFILKCDERGCTIDPDAIKPTDEFRKIGNWNARKVIVKVKGMMGEQISWYTKDYQELISARRLWGRFTGNLLKVLSKDNPELKKVIDALDREGERIIKEFGVPVMDEVEVGGLKSISSVLEVKSVDVTPSMLSLPPGYRKVEINEKLPNYER